MANLVSMSEAGSIALHAMILVAETAPGPVSVKAMSAAFGVSANHCSKVMQRLAKAGLAKAVRGPAGGFVLARSAREIRMLDIYEAIEGRLADSTCLFREAKCEPGACIFGGMLSQINRIVRGNLAPVTLAEMAERNPFMGVAGKVEA